MILAGTGHRPEKLGGYEPRARAELIRVAGFCLDHYKPRRVISGMALGFDQALALAALLRGIPLVACVPFAGQELRWPLESQQTYHAILAKADAVEVVCKPGYDAQKMQLRNIAMVEACTLLLACWDGTAGGTANCIRYAERGDVKRPIFNCYPYLDRSAIAAL